MRRIRRHRMAPAAIVAVVVAAVATGSGHAQGPASMPGPVPKAAAVASYRVVGDAIPEPLAGLSGDATRGLRLALDPDTGNCAICHPTPGGDLSRHGNVGPPLAGVASRLTKGQMRLRVVDATRINPDTIMPAYHRLEGLRRIGKAWQGKPVLSAQQVEDVLTYLETLKE